MKTNNKLKLGIILSTFVTLTFSSTPVEAGLYGSSAILPTIEVEEVIEEVHEPVDAGIADMAPGIISTFVALSGFATTSFLIKKTK